MFLSKNFFFLNPSLPKVVMLKPFQNIIKADLRVQIKWTIPNACSSFSIVTGIVSGTRWLNRGFLSFIYWIGVVFELIEWKTCWSLAHIPLSPKAIQKKVIYLRIKSNHSVLCLFFLCAKMPWTAFSQKKVRFIFFARKVLCIQFLKRRMKYNTNNNFFLFKLP